jgi:hypothetical protein
MAFAGREQFQKAAALRCRVRSVDLPGVGEVGVRILRGTEQIEFARELRSVGDADEAAMLACAKRWLPRVLCDEAGAPILTSPEDAALLEDLGAIAVVELFVKVASANGFGPKEEIEAGFQKTPTASGGSA